MCNVAQNFHDTCALWQHYGFTAGQKPGHYCIDIESCIRDFYCSIDNPGKGQV